MAKKKAAAKKAVKKAPAKKALGEIMEVFQGTIVEFGPNVRGDGTNGTIDRGENRLPLPFFDEDPNLTLGPCSFTESATPTPRAKNVRQP